MTPQEIQNVLDLHKKWRLNEDGGSRADLRGADLRGAYLTGAYLRGAYLRGADLTRADLRGADLTGADLTRADLTGAYLRGADLTRADLTGADLRGAYLTGADLTGADLRGADLTGAYLTGAKYKDIILTQTPFQLQTDKYWVLIFDTNIQIGCQFHSHGKWENFTDREILEMDGKQALTWWKEWQAPILQMAKIQASKVKPAIQEVTL